MKILNGSELAGFIKERQLKQVRALRQAHGIIPRLAIVKTGNDPVIDTYVRLKSEYGADLTVEVDVHDLPQSEIIEKIKLLNNDSNVHGIIMQLPLTDPEMTDVVLNTILPEKDVDGLCAKPIFVPATAMAIDWLMAGYNINLTHKKIAIVGNGRLVGAPLYKIWKKNGFDVTLCDSKTDDLTGVVGQMDVIVSATGVPGLITSDMVKSGAVVIDAGTAAEHGKIVGDIADDVRARNDLTVTPARGGVGPLTVTALFDNVISAAQKWVVAKR